MRDIRMRIIKNCQAEARAFVRHGITMPTRSEEFVIIREEMIIIEQKEYDAELVVMWNKKAQRITDRLNACFGDEWMEWAKGIYIDRDGAIISTARDWKTDMSWTYDNEYEKLKIIERLINYKMRDRLRGRGDVNKDVG